MEEQLDHERVEKIAFVLKTIAHPMRVAIIDLLNANEKMSVNDTKLIENHLNCNSQHQAILYQHETNYVNPWIL